MGPYWKASYEHPYVFVQNEYFFMERQEQKKKKKKKNLCRAMAAAKLFDENLDIWHV